MIPSKVPLSEYYNDYVGPGKRYSFKQVIHQQRVLGRKVSPFGSNMKEISLFPGLVTSMVHKFCSLIFQLGLVIDLTNTSRYYPASDLKKEGIKHVKVLVGFDSILS